MKTETAPQTKYLKDYQPPAFLIEKTELSFDLRPGITTVTATTVFIRQHSGAALVLDGQGLELVSVSLDGINLSPDQYAVTDDHLTLPSVPDRFTLQIVTRIKPEENTTLEGLYSSGGNYCTQCEPEGFRHITYFLDRPDVMTVYTVRIEADKTRYPVLLSNGNLTAKGDLPDGRHYTVWHDPFKKPTYLFALVAGDLASIHDTFKTASGRTVDLYIYVNHGNEDKCAHAMKALKDSMKWDEEKYGREYDLDLFNIVAVNDFNFGAMENKSLNIFNAKLVLAKPETATDADYGAIESVVAHEYFHNWTGNRITCRDWFQLSLKEGLTVFRDQSFSGDMNDHAVQRIDDVEQLRNIQFPEDASPMAHPIRPDNYIEINNFYTPTVYEKGAEVIRMLHTLLGPETYRKATDLYFTRHDGQAVTCDDFVQCMADASGLDLAQFKLWYIQAGTPVVTATQHYDAAAKTYSLTLKQHVPDTFGQSGKKPMHIPALTGLLSPDGKDLLPEGSRLLHLTGAEQTFTFDNIPARPVPSVFRGFSAPVKLEHDLSDEDLLFLMAHDSDGFNRWDAGQSYFQRLILSMAKGRNEALPASLIAAVGRLLDDTALDRALLAKALTLPSETYLGQLCDVIDVDAIHTARQSVLRQLAMAHQDKLRQIYTSHRTTGTYSPDPLSVGKRRLCAVALRYLQAADAAEAEKLAGEQYKTASNMTEQIAALALLADGNGPARDAALADFHARWKHDPLVLDKWFAVQAAANRPDTVKQVRDLTAHPDFTYKTPNRLRALIGGFAANLVHFHKADGSGYDLLADTIITVNAINPSTAARLTAPFRLWKRYDTARQGLMEKALRRILDSDGLSPDVYEIASKSLKG